MRFRSRKSQAGFSFIELLITIAVVGLFFAGLFAAVQLLLDLMGRAKATAGASALATERMEYIRSLPYNDVGTIGSPPYGNIPQTSTTTLNGVTYSERVLITYIDDPADGLVGADSNGIIDDYKLVKITYSWELRGKPDSLSMMSNVVPVGIETTTGGGTIRVNVFDAAVQPVESAEVHFFNDTLPTTTDTTRFTNSDGVAFLSGAPAGANYEITVTKTDYSTDGTYTASTSNPNPITPPVAVVESAVSTMNFQIDETSDILVRTVNPATTGQFSDDFTTSGNIWSQASTTLVANAVVLTQNAGQYDAVGTTTSATTTPGTLAAWEAAAFSATTSASTTVRIFVYYHDGSGLAPVSAGDLPGNTAGFTTSPIDLTGLSTSTYQNLALVGVLETTDNNYTPEVGEWSISHVISQAREPNVNFRIFGTKTIGTDALSQPVLKYDKTFTTDGSGESDLNGLEWDIYDIEVLSAGYDIAEVCEPIPYSLDPNTSETISLTLVSSVAQSLTVLVTDTATDPIAGATVRLERSASGIDQTSNSSLCGQSFFNSGLVAADDYTLTVSKSGYTTEVVNGVSVSVGTSTATVVLN